MGKRALLVFACVSLASSAFCQSRPTVPGVKLATPPKIDGTIDPAEWGGVTPSEGMFSASDGVQGPFKTEYLLAYDDKYIYFAGRAFDDNPKGIFATEYRQNTSISSDDFLGVAIDPTLSLGDFNQFAINARGATSLSLSGGRALKREWLGEFLAAGRITETGYEVEAAIPWALIKVPGAGVRNLAIQFSRNFPRQGKTFVYRYIPPGQSQLSPYWTEVQVPQPKSERDIKLLPYVYMGYDPDTDEVVNSGFDLKTKLNDNIDFIGTVNPDFRNIENSILSLDFSRFERIASETRPFFLEGSRYWGSSIFLSQRIGEFDAGFNINGRINSKTNFGFLHTADFGNRYDVVGQISHNTDPNTEWRLATTFLSKDGLDNSTYLLRVFKSMGPYWTFLRQMGSYDSKIGDGIQQDFQFGYSLPNWNFSANYAYSQPKFAPRLGFVNETDIKGMSYYGSYNYSFKKGPIQDVGVESNYDEYDDVGGDFHRRQLSGAASFALRNRLFLSVNWQHGRYETDEDRLMAYNFSYPNGNRKTSIGLGFANGRLASHSYKTYAVAGTWQLTPLVSLNGRYQRLEHFEHGNLAILGINMDINKLDTVSGRIVRRDKSTSGYVSFRRSGNRGIEYYLIYGDPQSEKFRGSLILKAAIPVEIKR